MRRRAILYCGYVERGDFARSAADLKIMYDALLRRGVDSADIHWAISRPALRPDDTGRLCAPEPRALAALFARLASDCRDDDHLLFAATNHAREEGLLIDARPVDEFGPARPAGVLAPSTLGSWLDACAGRHHVVLGTCHAGAFAPIARDDRRAVYAACARGQIIQADSDGTPFLRRMFIAWAGIDGGARRTLDEAFHLYRNDPPRLGAAGDGPPILPERHGSAAWPDHP